MELKDLRAKDKQILNETRKKEREKENKLHRSNVFNWRTHLIFFVRKSKPQAKKGSSN